MTGSIIFESKNNCTDELSVVLGLMVCKEAVRTIFL
jgi:hypothetical protein